MSKHIHFISFTGTFEALFRGIFSKNGKFDSLNMSVYVSSPFGWLQATQNTSRANALSGILFRHSFVFAKKILRSFLIANTKPSVTARTKEEK